MSATTVLHLAQRGVITLPKELREAYGLKPGDTLTLLDLGGVFVLSPTRLEVESLADRVTQALVDQGETLESVLQALHEEREAYGKQG